MIKLLAINKEKTLIGISDADFLNKELTAKLYNNSDASVSLMPLSEHLNLGAIISDGFIILHLNPEYHPQIENWMKDYILI